jgi:putative ABC transport system permease protein
MWLENIRQALASVRSNWLRSVLTMLIIAFGIMSMVGILTSIDGIKYWLRSSFSTLGANTFVIQNTPSSLRIGGRRDRTVFPPITYDQARNFKERFQEDNLGIVNIRATGTRMGVAQYQSNKTNNNIQVLGTDENFLVAESYEVEAGRTINPADVENNRKVVVIGYELKKKLFPYTNPINKHVVLNKQQYQIIGLLKERGTAMGSPGDKVAFIPITTMNKDFPDNRRSFNINVYVKEATTILASAEVAWSLFRIIRKLGTTENTNFSVVLSDSFVNDLMENLKILTLSSTLISIITLFGASIGLMNIMLVSVTERTMEIGVRKAMGATSKHILAQFLTEAITICQIGGMLGILLGIGMGFGVSKWLQAGFVIPWVWIIVGIVVCFVVGIVSGIYPARRAARLDPIDSLRYE